MKTLLRSTCALAGRPIRLICDRGAYAVIVAGESIGCGFDRGRALATYASALNRGRDVRLNELDAATASALSAWENAS